MKKRMLKSVFAVAAAISGNLSLAWGQLPDGWDGDRLLALVDGDMAATAYADGKLHPIPTAKDVLFSIPQVVPSEETTRAQNTASVPNTVMGWPGSMVVSTDQRFAYIVSSRGSVAKSVSEFDDGVFSGMPVTETLSVIDLSTMTLAAEQSVCRKPMSVDIAPDSSWLLVTCGDATQELAIVPLVDGLPEPPRAIDLDLVSYSERDVDAGATYGKVHPSGASAAIVLSNRAVGLVRFEQDAEGVPLDGVAEAPIETKRWLSVGRWTKSGNHFLVADTGWGPAATDAVMNKNSDIVSFALSPDDIRRGVVSTARVSKSPEAMEFNRDKDLLAVVNMERTYLPGGFPTGLFRHRKASSLSLVKVDDETGELATLGKPMTFRGVLPEDAVFDADGDHIAVVVYQDHGRPRSDGWVTFFRIDGTGDNRRPVETGVRVPLPRGGHDLAAID
ncbi:MAG: hypothetical protein AAFR03_12475 [Pseudomonadota bacterium]